MDIGSIFVLLALTLLVVAYVARPWMPGSEARGRAPDRRFSELAAARERILDALQELELDFATGKIPEDAFRAQRAELVQQGAEVLRALDELPHPEPAAPVEPRDADALEAELEAAVASLRGGESRPDSFCVDCGTALVAGDRFCARCGKPVEQEEPVT